MASCHAICTGNHGNKRPRETNTIQYLANQLRGRWLSAAASRRCYCMVFLRVIGRDSDYQIGRSSTVVLQAGLVIAIIPAALGVLGWLACCGGGCSPSGSSPENVPPPGPPLSNAKARRVREHPALLCTLVHAGLPTVLHRDAGRKVPWGHSTSMCVSVHACIFPSDCASAQARQRPLLIAHATLTLAH